MSVGPSEGGLSLSSDDVRVERQSHFPPIEEDHFIFFAATLPSIWTADRRDVGKHKRCVPRQRGRERGLPSRLVRSVRGRRRRRWEPPWVLQMQRKRPNTRNITLTRAGGASTRAGRRHAGRRRHLMPLVNCGEGGKRQIAKRINCERRGKWQSYERRERRREEGNVSSTYDATLLALWLGDSRSEQVSPFRRSTWGMFKINKERSGGPPSTTTTDGTTGK